MVSLNKFLDFGSRYTDVHVPLFNALLSAFDERSTSRQRVWPVLGKIPRENVMVLRHVIFCKQGSMFLFTCQCVTHFTIIKGVEKKDAFLGRKDAIFWRENHYFWEKRTICFNTISYFGFNIRKQRVESTRSIISTQTDTSLRVKLSPAKRNQSLQ